MLLGMFNSWLRTAWRPLQRGQRLGWPAWLERPRDLGFHAPTAALQVGQVRDWVLPVDDGSRLHIHEYSDGRLIVHRDQYDPEKSLGSRLLHILTETPVGPLVALWVIATLVDAS